MADKKQTREQKLKAAQAAQQKQARDLSDDGGVTVPTGQEQTPTGSGKGLDARKAIFNKSREKRDAEISQGEAGDAELAEMNARYNREQGTEDAAEDASQQQAREEPQQPKQQPQQQEPEPDPNELITVTINGERRQVPRRDVDRNGGIEAYQREVSANERYSQAAAERRAVAEERQKLEQERQAFERERQQQASQPQQQRDHSGPAHQDDAEFDSMSDEQLADAMFTGDRKKMARIMGYMRRKGMSVPQQQPAAAPQQAQVPRQQQQPPAQQQPRPAGRFANLTDMERSAVDNAMAAPEYKDLFADRQTTSRVQQVFKDKLSDPANAHRQAVDIARDAADFIRREDRMNPMRNDLQKRQEAKQNLPQRSRSTAAPSPVEPDTTPMTRSGVVDMMREKRGQASMSGNGRGGRGR